MRFLPEDKKRKIGSIIILLLAIGGTVYFLFFVNRPAASPGLPPVASSEVTGQAPPSELLPYGDRIRSELLEDERFKNLHAAPALELKPEEIGKTDLFGP